MIAKLVDSKDSAVRENSICVLSEIYKQVDEDIWRVMGTVPLKVKGLLETRFKKVKGGLNSSASNLNLSAKRHARVSPKRIGGGSSGQEALTKSFNPGLKNSSTTPRATGLKFNNASAAPDA